MVSFNDEASLGQVIEKKQMFSFGAAPIQQFKEIVFAAGGNKFSSLCGFKFTSKADTEYKEFFISFVCKLRSKIYRQASANPSQWFIFKKISGKELHCMDKESMLAQYGFDVDLFFKSDLFEQGVKKFKQAINKGLKDYVPAYVKAHGAEKAKSMLTSYDGQNNATVADAVGRYTKAIEDSLEYISDLRCNDKFYKLIDYGITVEKDNDEVVQEANFECEVKKEDDRWAIYEKDGHLWVATFHDEIAANEFAKQYPKLKAEYLKKAAAIEAEDSLVEDDNSDGAKVNESQKALTVKDVLDDINQWVNEDDSWLKTKFYVNAPDGNTYETSYVAASDDIDSGALVLELGKKYKALDRFHGRRRPPFEAEDEEAKLKEKELDNDIEESIDRSIPKNWIAFCKDLRAKVETAVKVLVGKHFNDFKGTGTELVNSILGQIDYLMFDEEDFNEAGNLYDSYFHTVLNNKTEAEEKQEVEEDNEEKIKEKELDNDIEEALKDIYK